MVGGFKNEITEMFTIRGASKRISYDCIALAADASSSTEGKAYTIYGIFMIITVLSSASQFNIHTELYRFCCQQLFDTFHL